MTQERIHTNEIMIGQESGMQSGYALLLKPMQTLANLSPSKPAITKSPNGIPPLKPLTNCLTKIPAPKSCSCVSAIPPLTPLAESD